MNELCVQSEKQSSERLLPLETGTATLRIGGLVNDSVVDGPGLRLAVFTQGCQHFCEGCHNPQSHDINGGYVVYLHEILALIDKNPLLEGVTFSGGEPMLQHEALALLAKEIKQRGLNLMVYTGYTWEELMLAPEKYMKLLELTDILVDGPFVKSQQSYKLKFRGSKNQRIIDVGQSLKTGRLCRWY